MPTSQINIEVTLDENKMPTKIAWQANQNQQTAKAFIASFWNGADKTALRLDLWTKEMMVDEMADFYFQTLITMADSFERSTHNETLANDLKLFAKQFYAKFREQELAKNQSNKPL